MSGCSEVEKRGFMPGYSDGQVTNHTERITNMWVGSWTALLVVGVITWALMLWCVVVYRKRKGDRRLPTQTRYHLPLEIMYTAVPLVLVAVMFAFTVRDMTAIRDVSGPQDVTIEVIGKQWSWDFNYDYDETDPKAGAWDSGQQVDDVGALSQPIKGEPGTDESLPTLYLPANKVVLLKLESRDVIHSFWVPAFLDKMDMIPSRTNLMKFTPLREGVYAGKCAELCGSHHSGMLFNVKIVPFDEYQAHVQDLKDKGQGGQLGLDLNRKQDGAKTPAAKDES